MSIVNAKQILQKASAEGYAVGAFNVTDLVEMMAVVGAAERLRAPVIVQASVTPSRFFGNEVVVALYRALCTDVSIPVCLHLDHCTEVEYCKACADAGYTNVMIDASREPFEENIRQTREVCDYAHEVGATVEGELGMVAGVEDQVKVAEDEALLCDPDSAVEFVERSGVDLFAPAIGTAHGVYKPSVSR